MVNIRNYNGMSDKQKKARIKNHNIMRLRGCYTTIKTIGHQFGLPTQHALYSIDKMLDRIGVETCHDRSQRLDHELKESLSEL